MASITDKNDIRNNRVSFGDDSMPISTRLWNDFLELLRLVESITRSERLVEATVDSILSPNSFSTDTVISGGYAKVMLGNAVIIKTSTDAQGKRFKLVDIGSGGTPDITIDANPAQEGIAAGDTYIIIYGEPATEMGHAHTGVDSEFISSTSLAGSLLFSDMFGDDSG